MDSTRASLEALLDAGAHQEDSGQPEAALATYRDAQQRYPASGRAAIRVGNVLLALRQPDAAEALYRQAVALEPDLAGAHLNLGNVLLMRGRHGDAAAAYRAATQLRPGWAEAWAGLGCAFEEAGQPDPAVDAYRQALRCGPGHGGAAYNLSGLLHARGDTGAAKQVLLAAVAHAPHDLLVLGALAHVHSSLAEHREAAQIYRRVLAAEPNNDAVASNLLFTMNFDPDIDAATLLREHRAWADGVASRTTALRARTAAEPERRLNIGYVSPDFQSHAVAMFIIPVLRQHDPVAVRTFCYSNLSGGDRMTEQIRSLAHEWRPIAGLPDEVVARRIVDDGIDILVDLAGHTAGNRLGVFALKPAPLQFTWLGYLGTTGLGTIDYRICDRHTDPVGAAESWQVEQPARMPASQWCYQPVVEARTTPLPRLARGYWTFGSFNQLSKVNAALLHAWAGLLLAVPDSRLRIASPADAAAMQRIRELLASRGVDGSRITFAGRLPVDQYMASYGEVDVALDTFPYTGGTTTCDALFMGVPVATIAGHRSIARSGVSLLSTLDLTDWIADSLAALPGLVIEHLADPDRLARLRAELPARMRASPLMDAPRFVRDLEALYRQAWRKWCTAEALRG